MREVKGFDKAEQLKTLTVVELATQLLQFCQQDKKVAKYKVYLSSDPEGNSYSTLDTKWSFQFGDHDKILTIMPFNEGLDDDDIAPIEMEKVMAEIRKGKQ